MILKKIDELAKQHDMSITALEKKLSFGNGTIRSWDKCSPSIEKLKKVADYFDVTVDYFLEE